MTKATQKLCAWCGIVCTILWLAGCWPLAHFLPPPLPSAGADAIAAFYRSNPVQFRIGMEVLMLGAVLYLPWSASISVQLKRIEGQHSPLSYTQMLMGAIFVWVFVLPVLVWLAAAYRPDETSPELIQRLNDLGWIGFINPVFTIFVQGIAIGIVILQDKRSKPIFPRWVGWFNIWAVIIYLPGALVPFFKSGPFAWNGLLALWIPLMIFVSWMVLMSILVIQAVNRQYAEGVEAGDA